MIALKTPTPRENLDQLARDIGPTRLIILALLSAFGTRAEQKRRARALELNEHLRRDIGLGYVPPSIRYKDNRF